MNKPLLPRSVGYVLVAVLIVALFAVGFIAGRALMSRPAPTPTQSPLAGAGIVSPPKPVADFTLTGHTGESISLSSLRGRAVLLFFGYTHCPEECPTTLANFKRVKEALGPLSDQTAFVFVSVDGERDTPEVVAEYLRNFDPGFVGMTGTDEELARVGQEYGLYYERVSLDGAPIGPTEDHGNHHEATDETAPQNDNYFVAHTSPAFLIDPEGRLQLVFFYGADHESMANGVRQVLGAT